MLNYLWPIFIIISFVFAIISGNIENLNSSIFESIDSVISLSMTLVGTMCLWCGIMEVVKNTSIMSKLTKLLKPVILWLFPDAKYNKEALDNISINVVSNILGLGNAATPLGLKAMETMQKENPKKDTLSNSMAMFIVLNTASLQLIPTNVIAIRSSLGSSAPSNIILQVWVASIIAAVVGITATKIFMKKF